MMSFEKDEIRRYVAVRCYADALINQNVVDDYYEGTISVRRWMELSTRIEKLEDVFAKKIWRRDAKRGENIAASGHVIGPDTAVIIKKYAQAKLRKCNSGITIGPAERVTCINRISRLIFDEKTEVKYNMIVLDHPEIGDVDRQEWTEALYSDIRNINLGSVYEIWLICGDNNLSATKSVDIFPDILLFNLAW